MGLPTEAIQEGRVFEGPFAGLGSLRREVLALWRDRQGREMVTWQYTRATQPGGAAAAGVCPRGTMAAWSERDVTEEEAQEKGEVRQPWPNTRSG